MKNLDVELAALLLASEKLLDVAENDGILLDDTDQVAQALVEFRDKVTATRRAVDELVGHRG